MIDLIIHHASDNDQWDNNNNLASLDPLIDLNATCFSNTVFSKQVLRLQWKEIKQRHTEKIISNQNIFLTQAMIGQSLYIFQLKWWYMQFDPSNIMFFCTKDF